MEYYRYRCTGENSYVLAAPIEWTFRMVCHSVKPGFLSADIDAVRVGNTFYGLDQSPINYDEFKTGDTIEIGACSNFCVMYTITWCTPTETYGIEELVRFNTRYEKELINSQWPWGNHYNHDSNSSYYNNSDEIICGKINDEGMWETHVIYDSDDVDNGNIGRETAQMWDEYNWGDGLMAAKEEWGHNQAEYSSNSNVYYVPEVDEHGNVVFREMLRGTHEDIELRRMPDLH